MSSTYTIRSKRLLFIIVYIIIHLLCGCDSMFEKQPTEKKSDEIRSEMRKIEIDREPNIVVPNTYKEPPSIKKFVGKDNEEYRLTYVGKHHLAEDLTMLVCDMFADHTKGSKGEDIANPWYNVRFEKRTNQLFVFCPTEEKAKSVLAFLEDMDIAPVQIKIDCIISDLYADKTFDQETSIQIQNLFGENIIMGGSGRFFGKGVQDLVQEGSILPAFPGGSLREILRSKMGLKIGHMSDEFLTLLDFLQSKGYAKILMNPSLEVVHGQTARISSSMTVPLEHTFLRDREGFVESKMEYVDVVDSLEITAYVFADGSIGLETTATIGSKNTPEGIKQIRVISKKEIFNKENRIRQGESLVIGGIRKSEEHSVERGVPILKDIPILGLFFSSFDYEERAVETVFILTPTISVGGTPNKQMAEMLEDKHKSPEKEEL